ncbi:MAG: hypothetical protein ABJB04_01965 [Betaproteobacteria bacterium]
MESPRTLREVRSLAVLAFVTCASLAWPVRAATPEEGAAAAAQRWVKAVVARDVDTQSKLLPKGLFAKPEDQERDRKLRMRDNEVAAINGEKILSFDLQPTGQSGRVGKMTLFVFPYRSITQSREGKMQRDSSLLAVAEEGSSNWSVIDGSGQSARSMRGFLPGYAGAPPIPRAAAKVLKPE